MRKRVYVWMLLMLCLLMCGCSGKNDAADAAPATETPPPVEVPSWTVTSFMEETAQRVLAPYQDALERLSRQEPLCIAHTIPGSMLYQLAGDAQRTGAQPENGRYRFTAAQSAVSTYQATGLEVTADMALQSPDPENEAPMGEGSVGDLLVTGGGRYERQYEYDAAETLTDGTVEITETLDGERTGWERFRFAVTGDAFCFVDAAAEMTVQGNDLESAGACLVTVGRLEKEKAEIIEYLLPSENGVPALSDADWFSVPANAEVQGHYKTK